MWTLTTSGRSSPNLTHSGESKVATLWSQLCVGGTTMAQPMGRILVRARHHMLDQALLLRHTKAPRCRQLMSTRLQATSTSTQPPAQMGTLKTQEPMQDIGPSQIVD
jgi:hypothetical protein